MPPKNLDNFTADYEKAERLCKSILADVKTRDQLKIKGESIARLSAQLRGQLSELGLELEFLEKGLQAAETNTSPFKLTERELGRRRDKVRVLVEERRKLEEMVKNPPQSKQAESLVNEWESRSRTQRMRDGEESKSMSGKDMLQQQKMLLRDQDEALDALGGTVENLKQIGLSINDEADLHVRLLDDMDTDIDRTAHNMERNTRRVKNIGRQSSNSLAYITIIVLIVIIILLLFVF
eukprot:GILI01030031.1.p1 GENE.GILI01030031.1~~GILI01030031.1.p1  ORF type:complete len:237 (-),score=58.62 GILI01030031.1:50-760(-)